VDAQNECREFNEFLVPFLDGELSTSEAEHLELHLTQCETCQSALALHRQVKEHLASSAGLPSSIDLTTGVRRRLARQQVRTRAVIALAAATLLALGVWLIARVTLDGVDRPTDGGPQVVADDEVIENLDVLEFLDDEGVDLELVQALLGELDLSDDDTADSVDDFWNEMSQL